MNNEMLLKNKRFLRRGYAYRSFLIIRFGITFRNYSESSHGVFRDIGFRIVRRKINEKE